MSTPTPTKDSTGNNNSLQQLAKTTYSYHREGQQCSTESMRLGVCANILGGLLGWVRLGVPEYKECCALLEPLLDLEAAVCLCTAVRANVLSIKLDVSVGITLQLNHCGKECPADFTCQA